MTITAQTTHAATLPAFSAPATRRASAPVARHTVKSLMAATATTFAMLVSVNALATSEPPAALVQQIHGGAVVAHQAPVGVQQAG